MNSFKFHRQATILFLIFAYQICIGQEIDIIKTGTIELGKKYTFHSDVLNEEREFWVRLPKGYDSEIGDYPVVYLLDAKFSFNLTAGLLGFLEHKSVPKSILIGLVSTDRIKDFTPPPDDERLKEYYPTAGGADNFMKMFEEEIFPFINTNFRTNKFKTLIGGSAGGIFVIHSLSAKPDLFNSYLCIGPSLGVATNQIVGYFEQKLKVNPEMKALLYLTMGNEAGADENGLMKLISVLETESPKNLRWGYKIHPDETHQSNMLISQLEGFEFFYNDWFVPNPVQDYLQNGFSSFERRAERILNEFNEDWDLEDYQYLSIIQHLITLDMFSEVQELGLILLKNNITSFLLMQTLANVYLNHGDRVNAIKFCSEAYKSGPGHPGIIRMMDSLDIDKSSLIRPVTLSTKDFEQLTGVYINDWNGNEITISYSRDTIFFLSPDGKFQLIPSAKNKAYFINSATTVEFNFDVETDGRASYFILRLGDGEKLKCTRKDM